MNIIGMIQARVDSTRLPGKVLKPILGKTMLANLVERCQRSSLLTDLVVITPAKDMTAISRDVRCKVYADIRIEEDDLLTRFAMAAESFQADFIVRICSDNPCIDAVNIDLLVHKFVKEGIWHSMGSNLGDWEKTRWPQGLGVEIYPLPLFDWMYRNLTEPEQREHPHTYPHEVDIVWEPDCPFEWEHPLRLEVNTEEDFEYVSSVFKHFGNNEFSSKQVVTYFQGEKQRV